MIKYYANNSDKCKNFYSNHFMYDKLFYPEIGSVLCIEYCSYCKSYNRNEKYIDCSYIDELIELRNKKIESL